MRAAPPDELIVDVDDDVDVEFDDEVDDVLFVVDVDDARLQRNAIDKNATAGAESRTTMSLIAVRNNHCNT